MQRGFGMGKQHLILTAWLSRGGVQCRGSRLPRWCQIVQPHYWCRRVSMRQNDAVSGDQSSSRDTDIINRASFIFMYSCTNQSMCSSLQFLTQVFMKRAVCWSMRCHPNPTKPMHHFHCLRRTRICPRFPMIFNQAPLRLTLNFELLLAHDSEAYRGKYLTVCILMSFLPLTRSPFRLVLTTIRSSVVRSLSLSIYSHWLLTRQV